MFLNFALNLLYAGLGCPAFKYIVFQQLLRNRAGALVEVETVCNARESGADNPLDVNAVVVVESFVLNGYKRV